jgi:predicted enzyme related to lactoylglutathione lyase
MYKKQVPGSKPLNYFAVESISDFLSKIEKMGGRGNSAQTRDS